MEKYPKEEDMVYMDCSIRMSNVKMADVLYAVVMSRARITTSHCLSYEYSRKQNCYNMVDLKIHIHPNNIEEFEKHSGIKLEKPISITLN